ncbi:MAG: AI-2 transport protein TqsA [Polyangiales bacterium]
MSNRPSVEETPFAKDPPIRERRFTHTAQTIIAAVVVVLALRETAFITAPLAIAVFGAILVWPLQSWMRQRMPGPVATILTSATVITTLMAVTGGIVYTFSDFARGLPGYPQIFRETTRGIRRFLPTPAELTDTVTNSLGLAAQGLASQVASIALTLTFMVMIIGESEAWRERIVRVVVRKNPELKKGLANVVGFFRSYMLIHTMMSLLTGFLTLLVTWAFGVRDPHVWGLLTFFLNYIPNIGSLIAVIPPAMIAFADISPTAGLVLFFTLGSIQFLIGNWLEPWVLGRNFQLSSLVAFGALAFWGWVWGLGGALIAVPCTVFLLALARESKRFRWMSDLVTTRTPPKRKQVTPGAT